MDFSFTDEQRQRVADRLHCDAEVVGLVAVNIDPDRRLVEVEIAVDDHEETALARVGLDLGHRLIDRHEIARRIDNHLHRQAADRRG